MEKEFKFVIKILKNIKLSKNEKLIMRIDLLKQLNILETKQKDIINPIFNRFNYYFQDIKNNYFMINKNKFVSFVVIFILVFTGSTSVLAEKAIPGDLLYGVKISINEKIASIFALSKEEKTEWQERLVERRLKEAQKLVFNNNFDETTRISLENKIKNHIDKFSSNATELSLEKDKSLNSSDLNIKLQASLKAYENVLENFSEDVAIQDDTKQETEKLLVSLGEYKDKISFDNENLELNVGINLENVSTTPVVIVDITSATTKQIAASDLLNETKLLYQKEKINLSINIQNKIDNKFALAEINLQEGEKLMTSFDYVNSTDKFQLVINETNEAKLLMLSNVIKGDIEDDIGIEDSNDINDDDSLNDKEGDGIEDDIGIEDSNDINDDSLNDKGNNLNIDYSIGHFDDDREDN